MKRTAKVLKLGRRQFPKLIEGLIREAFEEQPDPGELDGDCETYLQRAVEALQDASICLQSQTGSRPARDLQRAIDDLAQEVVSLQKRSRGL